MVVSFTTLAHVRLGWLGGLAVSRDSREKEKRIHNKQGKSTWWDGREYQGEETFPETMEMFKCKQCKQWEPKLVFDDSMILYSLPSQSLFQLLSRAVSNV